MIIGIANIIGCKVSSGNSDTAPSNLNPPSLTGSGIIGTALICSDGIWVGTLPITFTYQWKRNGSNIVGEVSSTYTLVNADYGNSITCEVTATNIVGMSSSTSDIIVGTATAPSVTTDPVISGTNAVGQTLSCTTGTWTGTPVISYIYQWKRNGSDISGATSSTYVLVQADASNTITCVVTATNVAGSASATSSNSFVILDADAYAFLTAAAITNTTITNAINTLCIDLKSNNLWTKFKAIYPIVGGTATTHKYNLKDPQDTDAAFRIVFNGGWTHSSTGAAPNGINATGDTKFNPVTTSLNVNSNHHSVYLRTNSTPNAFVDIGQSNPNWLSAVYWNNSATFIYNPTNTYSITVFPAGSNNLSINTRRSSTDFAFFNNNTKLGTNTTLNTLSFVSGNVFLASAGGSSFLSTRQIAFASIGSGFNDTEAGLLYTLVQAFQTTLSRQV